jgi:tetratricopeptide (TPR) repeat protein
VLYILEIYPGTKLYLDYQRKFNATDDIWLEGREGMCYFETDPSLSQELVLAFGKKLRTALYENMPHFVESIDLIDKKELYPMHADFLSRLGMTFSHGDYSKVELIPDKDGIAQGLFERSLDYHPNHRAYLGLGMIKQKGRAFHEAIRILSKGVELFPDSEELNLCLGISYMNLQDFEAALSHLLKFKHLEGTRYYIDKCHEALSS